MKLFLNVPVITAKQPLLGAVPNIAARLISVSDDPSGWARDMREAARYLKNGGALLTFPAGKIEPDPAVMDNAHTMLDDWSDVTTLFGRVVLELPVVGALISGVISARTLRNWWIRTIPERKDCDWGPPHSNSSYPCTKSHLCAFNHALEAYPDAPTVFVWDDELLTRYGLRFKRIVFMYEALLELPVTIYRGDVVEHVRTFAQHHHAQTIVTSDTPAPRFAAICQQLRRTHTVEILAEPAFVEIPVHTDIKRFSRYWNASKHKLF